MIECDQHKNHDLVGVARTTYKLKRPDLFCSESNPGKCDGWLGKFSDLLLTTEGVCKSRDYAAYIRLLKELNWLELKKPDLPISGRTLRLYEIANNCVAFLRSFSER